VILEADLWGLRSRVGGFRAGGADSEHSYPATDVSGPTDDVY
jgi:hypothetical protein